MRNLLIRGVAVAALTSAAPALAEPDYAAAIRADYQRSLGPLFDWFHRNPELSFRETATAASMAKELRAIPGIEVTEKVGGTGVVGEIWVHSVTHRPAVDTVSAALFLFGVVLVMVRYLRSRHWLDIFLLASIPLLQMPSTLSLSFPGENPALNRAGGALVPAFVVVAMALDGLLTGWGTEKRRILLSWVVTGSLVFASASQNFDLVFRQYVQEFRGNSWNTSEMGAVIKQFGQTYGTTDTAWVVPFPHWVDTRLPGVWAGIPNRDFAMWREDLPSTVQLPGPKLFIVKANVEDHPETMINNRWMCLSSYIRMGS